MKTHPQHPPSSLRRVGITHLCMVLKVSKVSLCVASRARGRFPSDGHSRCSQPALRGTARPALLRSAGPGRGCRRAAPGPLPELAGKARELKDRCIRVLSRLPGLPAAAFCGHDGSRGSGCSAALGLSTVGELLQPSSFLLHCPCPCPLSLASHCKI